MAPKARDAAGKPGAVIAITAREQERLAALDAEFGFPVGFFQELYEIIAPVAHDRDRLAALDVKFGFAPGFSQDLYEVGIEEAGSARELAVRAEKVRRHFFTDDGTDGGYVYDLPGIIEREKSYAAIDTINKARYPDDLMGDAPVDLNADAAELGLPPEIAREALKKAAADYARTMTGRAKDKPRLKWERDRLPDENPAAFAWRAYQAEAQAGTLHRGLIGQEDKPLAVKLASWLRSHPMPEDIDIPTKPEWISRRLPTLDADPASRETIRLHETRKRRAERARRAAPVM